MLEICFVFLRRLGLYLLGKLNNCSLVSGLTPLRSPNLLSLAKLDVELLCQVWEVERASPAVPQKMEGKF